MENQTPTILSAAGCDGNDDDENKLLIPLLETPRPLVRSPKSTASGV